ncbi:MAG TPA: hypothetical protein VID24_10860 [Candidatus Eremiobacteraceae bacterium]|jgi:DNA-binding beta-propeller fold protein YncE
MPIVPALPPHQIPIVSHFDYVTVDAERRRVYAAHSGSNSLTIVNADSGVVLGQVQTGSVHGVAVDEMTGDVFTGDGNSGTVSEVDSTKMTVLNSLDIGHPIDAIAYDPKTGRIFADEDSGSRVFVVDAKSFKLAGTVTIPGRDLEYLAVDPDRPVLYQNIPDHDEYAEIDTQSLAIVKVVETPELTNNHPLQFDDGYREVVVGGKNGVLSVYSADGAKVGQTNMPMGVDQCDLDQGTHVLACAGDGKLWTVKIENGAAPRLIDEVDTGHKIHTVAVDPKSHRIWTVWAGPEGDFVQAFEER